MTTKHGKLKMNDSPWTIDEKTTISLMVLTNIKNLKKEQDVKENLAKRSLSKETYNGHC